MEEEIKQSWEKFSHADDLVQELEWPWDIVKEIARQNRRFTYLDIHRGLSQFMRTTMVFFNHCLDGETLTAVCAIPFTEHTIKFMTDEQIFALAKMLCFLPERDEDKEFDIIEVMRQKLFDMIYAVEDAPRMHAVHMCQNRYKQCQSIATSLCGNKMCKNCCEDLQHRDNCIVHDSADQFFRKKIRDMSDFESRFDVKITLRLSMRKLIRLYELEKVFDGYRIDWDKSQFYFDNQTHRINYVYIACENQEEAQRILSKRQWFMQKLGRYQVNLSSLSGRISDAYELFAEPEHVLAILRPHSYLEVVEELPKCDELLRKLTQLVQVVTQLDPSEYTLESDFNPITGEQDYTRFFVTLPNRSYVNKLYEAQPFFGCLIAHKMTHTQLCPFTRYSQDICLMCDAQKNDICIRDMCVDCCSRQKIVQLVCPCSSQKIQECLSKRKEILKVADNESLCVRCYEKKSTNCTNRMCDSCCPIQAIRKDCWEHDLSKYDKEYLAMDPVLMARSMLCLVAEMHIKFRYELKRGRYDWFKPIYGTNIEESMIKANRDLQEIVDNGHLVRGHAPKKFTKDGRIFTYQANDDMYYWMNDNLCIREDMDHKGDPFVEYIFNSNKENFDIAKTNNDEPSTVKWVKSEEKNIRSYNDQEFLSHISMPNLNVKNNFQLFFMGLDKTNLTIKELYQEITIKMKMLIGEVSPNNMMIIDNESIIADIMNYEGFKDNEKIKKNLELLGRVVCIQFPSLLDAFSVITKLSQITLPLNDGSNSEPIIVPSSNFKRFMEEVIPGSTQYNQLINSYSTGGE